MSYDEMNQGSDPDIPMPHESKPLTDIGSINLEQSAEQGSWCEIKLPDGSASEIRILLRGGDSPAIEAVIDEWRRISEDADEKAAQRLMLKVVNTAAIAVEGLAVNGNEVGIKELPAVMKQHRKWMARQCFDHIVNRGNYYETLEGI